MMRIKRPIELAAIIGAPQNEDARDYLSQLR